MYRRPKELGKVVSSINEEGGFLCVDVFKRPNGTFGFEEYRSDPESGEGWFPIGSYCDNVFTGYDEAITAAHKAVPWLEKKIVELDNEDDPNGL